MTSGRIRVATFDCYGTLIDWEGGAGAFLYDLALRSGDRPWESARALREGWEAIQFELVQRDYRPYKEVLVESLRRWGAERGYAWNEADGLALVRSMRSWQPFPDTRPALLLARERGLRLVIVSNTDRDIIDHTLAHLEVPFDDVITAEECRAYKPSLTVFQQALGRIGESPERVLHVAFGFKYDIGPAQALGLRTAWVNRHAEPVSHSGRPDYVWRDLWGLPELLE
ncbi:MAG TPA: haloacid dehalogenase type II [Chloroflexota bacterium]|nr:haloacid dehalogenase type II [Chloroflexota bacterium]